MWPHFPDLRALFTDGADRRTARIARALAAAVALSALPACDRFVDAQIERTLARTRTELLRSPDLHVILCGTGSPLPDPDRASACTAVMAGGELLLFDVGPGAWKQVDLANLPTSALSGVFLTHFHSDHIGDLGEATTQSWIAGRSRPLDVYGPPGVTPVVAGFAGAYAADTVARVLHHGEEWLPPAAAGAVAHEFELPAPGGAPAVVLDRGGLRVLAFAVDHAPVSPAVGYRVEWAGRAVVISGDTKKSASLVAAARGADVLVHEALDEAAIRRAASVAARIGQARVAKLASDIPGYHTTPVEAAEIAREAGVRTLVLTHLVPAPRNAIMRRMFLSGADAAFDGEIVVGEDGMEIVLAPR